MTLTLELTPEQETKLQQEAASHGMNTKAYALALLTGEVMTPVSSDQSPASWSGADVVARWRSEGVIGSRADITDSQEEARRIRRQAEQRKAQS